MQPTSLKTDLTKSDRDRLWELRDHGPARRNAGTGWKINGWNRRRDGMDKLVVLGLARVIGTGRQAELHITDAGRSRLRAESPAGRKIAELSKWRTR